MHDQPQHGAQPQPIGQPNMSASMFSLPGQPQPGAQPLFDPNVATNTEKYFALGGQRYASVKIWKGRLYIGFRQFCFESGIWKPTRNGINLMHGEWEALYSQLEDINKAVAEMAPYAIYWP